MAAGSTLYVIIDLLGVAAKTIAAGLETSGACGDVIAPME